MAAARFLKHTLWIFGTIALTTANLCNNVPFEPESQVCCSGVIQQRNGSPYVGCCGNRSYRLGTQRCCNQNPPYIVNIQSPLDECCGPYRTYNTLTQRCCKGDLIVNLPGDSHYRNYACCGTRIYDTDLFVCCNDIVVPKPSPLQRYDCCGTAGQIFHRENQLCCNGVVRNKPSVQPHEVACCGTNLFNTKVGVCCQGQSYFRPSCWTGCCGNRPFNLDAFLCCENNLVPRPFFHTDKFKCCGTSRYDQRSNLCCQGRVIPKPGQDYDCCGPTRYDRRTQICCGGRLYQKAFQERTLCCGALSYNVQASICCEGRVSPRRFGRSTGCCRQNTYNVETDVCCADHTVYPISYFRAGYRC